MTADVVLHIGQPKTGTTTLQHLLAQNRDALSAVGVLYPDLGQINQFFAMADVLRRDHEAQQRFPAGLRQHLTEIADAVDGQFARLSQLCSETACSTIIISAENLVYAGNHTVDRLQELFAQARVHVVATTRPASSLICSAYQQLAHTQAVDEFESWVRATLPELISGHHGAGVGWIRTDVLLGPWARSGWRTSLIDMNGRPESTTAKLWEQVVPRLPLQRSAPVENRSYPAALVAATQEFIRRHPDLSVSRYREIEHRAFAADLGVPDYGLLGRFKLKPDVSALLDAALPHAGPEAVVDRHVPRLQQRLQSPEPLTYLELAPGVSHSDWRKEVATHMTQLDRAHAPSLPRQRVRRVVRTGLRSLRRVVAAE